MAMQIHLTSVKPERDTGFIEMSTTTNGFIGKLINYKGKASHAAAAPHLGVNALNAAMMGIMGVNAIRETFQERLYSFSSNHRKAAIWSMSPQVMSVWKVMSERQMSLMIDANERITRALVAGAMSVGAEVEVKDLPGYLPLYNNDTLNHLLQQMPMT